MNHDQAIQAATQALSAAEDAYGGDAQPKAWQRVVGAREALDQARVAKAVADRKAGETAAAEAAAAAEVERSGWQARLAVLSAELSEARPAQGIVDQMIAALLGLSLAHTELKTAEQTQGARIREARALAKVLGSLDDLPAPPPTPAWAVGEILAGMSWEERANAVQGAKLAIEAFEAAALSVVADQSRRSDARQEIRKRLAAARRHQPMVRDMIDKLTNERDRARSHFGFATHLGDKQAAQRVVDAAEKSLADNLPSLRAIEAEIADLEAELAAAGEK